MKILFNRYLILCCCLLAGCSTFDEYPSPQSDPSSSPPSPSASPPSPPTPVPTRPTATIIRKPAKQHTTNGQCIDLIKRSEGLRLNAYRGPSGAWLIGYGHMAGVSPGMTITTAQAEQILRDDLHEFERNVSRLVKVDVSANEFSAMVCLSYNIGWGNFGKSTVLRQVNRQHWSEAADAFLMWNKIKGNVSQHLTSRRTIERALFLLP